MKKYRYEKKFIAAMEKFSTISAACEKTGLSRQSVYRWMDEDEDFRKRVEDARQRGIQALCDLAEVRLAANVNSGSQRAIEYYLRTHRKEYYWPRKPMAPEGQRLVPITSLHFIQTNETAPMPDELKSLLNDRASSDDDVSKLPRNLS